MRRFGAAQSDPNQQQTHNAEYATLRYQLCAYLPAVTLYWVAAKQHSDFAAVCPDTGMCSAYIASVPASNVDNLFGSWPADQAPAVSEVTVSDTVHAAVLCINRLQQLRHQDPELNSSSSGSSSISLPSSKGPPGPKGFLFGEAVMMTLLSMLARLPGPQLASTAGNSGDSTSLPTFLTVTPGVSPGFGSLTPALADLLPRYSKYNVHME